MNPVAIFTATRWELQAVRRAFGSDRVETVAGVRCHVADRGGRTYWMIQTGIGPAAASRVAGKVLNERAMSLVISTGFACALVPAQAGDLLIGTAVSSVAGEGLLTAGNDRVLCDEAVRAGLLVVTKNARMAAQVGAFVSAPTVVCQAEGKQRIRRLTAATGLDMESAALAIVARDRGVPMAIVRTASDLMDEDLPLDFNLFLRPTGWLQGLRSVVRHPSSLAGLNRLRKQSRVAADRLTEWFQQYATTPMESFRLQG